MNPPPTGSESNPARIRPLRQWPAALLLLLGILARFGPGFLDGGMSSYWVMGLLGPLLCSVLVLVWWLTASRATGLERVCGFLALVVSLGLAVALAHPSMQGPGTMQFTLPVGMAVFATATLLLATERPRIRTGLSVLLAMAAFAVTPLLRNEGANGDYMLSMHWRWSKSAEELMLSAYTPDATPKPARAEAASPALPPGEPEWPAFRGGDRAGRSSAPRIGTRWTEQPPQLLWKIPVGPAWSSFAVAGNRLFTQEQRGAMETVVCYDAATGREIWKQQVEARFDDPLGGPGPRATPTLSKEGLFVTGATGHFLCLNPATGDILWRRDLKAVAGREPPTWGFSASPLVAGSVVVVHAGGAGDKGVLAFDVATGTLLWSSAAGKDSYSSPQLNRIAGENLILMLTNDGLLLLDPAGRERLNYGWKFMNYRALQPLVVGDDTVLLPTGMNTGTRAIRIAATNGTLAATELWTSRHLKPDFTDLVSYQGYVFGIDGGIFTCIDLKTGERKWKQGRYGKGQVLLLENSALLLVAAENGTVVLVRADPAEHAEVASFKAIEGKTWNHPVVVGDRLYIRNAQEAACYQLK